MTVLNIGGTGFVGSKLTEDLHQMGERIICVDIHPAPELEEENVSVVQGDVTDYEMIRSLIEEYDPDKIVNLAYVLGAESDQDPQQAVRVNCLGMDNIFHAACEFDVDRVIYASSIATYGHPEAYSKSIQEDVEPPAAYTQYPVLFYGATKQLNEYQARLYGNNDECETKFAAVRPSIIFGPGREGGLTQWASDIVTKQVENESVHIPFSPEQKLSLVYRDDVVDLFIELLSADSSTYHSYNTGGHEVTVRELVDIVKDEFNGTLTFDSDANESPLVSAVSHQRAKDEFGYDITPIREAMHKHAEEIS